jgi:hypothetical protein
MMTDQPTGERPGHLDIDAVSAFIDRDLHPNDLSALEQHLALCPACRREVLEIHATVLLLAGLPQYAPRRSFSLTAEHARAARRTRTSLERPWADPLSAHPYQAPAAARVAGYRSAGAFAGLHAAALMIGALLLLVTSSDFLGIPPQPAAWLEPEHLQTVTYQSVSPSQPATAVQPAARVASAPNVMVTATALASEAPSAMVAEHFDGTSSDTGTSQGLTATGAEAPPAPPDAATSIAAAMAQARPTAVASLRQSATQAAQGTVGTVAARPLPRSAEPSRLHLVELALAFALAWLIVTIAGLRWVRRMR